MNIISKNHPSSLAVGCGLVDYLVDKATHEVYLKQLDTLA